MKLNDDRNLRNNLQVAGGKFFYKPHNKKIFTKNKSSKKSLLFGNPENIFEDESLEFNDLDYNMLNRDMIKFLPTDSLRLELQMQRAENKLKKVNEEILSSKLLGINDHEKEELLIKRKIQLMQEINSYKIQYRKLGYVYMAADLISDAGIKIKNKTSEIKNKIFSIRLFSILLKKIPGYEEKQKLKALNMLQNKISGEINKKDKTDHKKLEFLFQKKETLS